MKYSENFLNPFCVSFLTGGKNTRNDFLRADLNADVKSIDTQSNATQDFFSFVQN